MSGVWQRDPPDGPDVLVYSDQKDKYFLLTKVGEDLWGRRGRLYNGAKLRECNTRSGWWYAHITLPAPPDSDWETSRE